MEETIMNETEWQAALESMRSAGARDGKAAGGWVADGNTSTESLREVLSQWDAGDPAAPTAPSPFSGEWADEPSARDMIDQETDCDIDTISPEEEDEMASAYEDAYATAWQEEAERTVRALLGDDAENNN